MVRMVKDYRKNPGVIQLAREIVRDLPQGDISGEIRALQSFVRDHIRYTNDPNSVELLQTPEATLEMGTGDCDDKSILLATLLNSIGRPARFAAISLKPSDKYSHVLVQARIGTNWYPLETIRDVPAGWSPDNISRVMIAHI